MADAATILRLRRKLGDTGTTVAFSDAELDTLLIEAGNVFDAALAEGLWELLAQGAKWHDYTVGASDEKRSQVFAQLSELHKVVTTRLGAAQAGQANTTPATSRTVPVIWTW